MRPGGIAPSYMIGADYQKLCENELARQVRSDSSSWTANTSLLIMGVYKTEI